MTTGETTVILAAITAAYPNAYKNMSQEEARAVVTVWAIQFADMPADIVFMAVNKAIATSKYPPTIAEVKQKVSALYWEAYGHMNENRFQTLTEKEERAYRRIMDVTQGAKYAGAEPTLANMIGSAENYLLSGAEDE